MITLIAIGFFCFQLSRFYIVIPGCWHGTNEGLSLQHCKDLPDGLGVNPVQLSQVPEADALVEPRVAWHVPPTESSLLLDASLAPPVPPPKLLTSLFTS